MKCYTINEDCLRHHRLQAQPLGYRISTTKKCKMILQHRRVLFKISPLVLALWLAAAATCSFGQQVAPPLLALPPAGLNLVIPPPPPPPLPAANPVITVPGSAQLMRQPQRVDQIILPYENFRLIGNQSTTAGAGHQPEDYRTSYVIDNKRFVEPYSTRCFSSTLLEDPDSVEPQFVIVRAGSEVRLNATVPAQAIVAAGYDAKLRTTIIVHGFTQSYPSTEWLRKTRALFEMHGLVARENLIIMDWGAASKGSYAQVAALTSGMGSFLANFLMKLLDLGADRRAIHIIGHSLGAHLAGFAGKRIRPHLGRITALDPAGPCFGKLFSNSANDRLSMDDAYQVAVFHYDDDFLGLATQLGHFDVYVNGGSSQPGAVDNMNAMVQAVITMLFRRNRVLSESHTRSTEVATSQLGRSGCQQIAYECRDWPAFLSGECGYCDLDNSQCFQMSFPFQYPNMDWPHGLRQSVPGKRMFVATGSTELFCLHHFQVLVKFEAAPDLAAQAKRNRWRLQLELQNDRRERSNVTLIHQMSPLVFSYLMLSDMQPSKFRSALLQVRSGHDNSLIQLRDQHHNGGDGHTKPAARRPYSQPFRVSSIEVNFMSHEDGRLRQALSSRLCPAGWLAQNAIADSTAPSADAGDEWLALEECRL